MQTGILETAMKMSLGLGTVLLVFGALAYLFKKYGLSTGLGSRLLKKSAYRDSIEILHTRAINPGKNLHIVTVEGKRILIGSTAQNISMLCELGDELDSPAEQAVDFSSSLKESSAEEKKDSFNSNFKSYLKENLRV